MAIPYKPTKLCQFRWKLSELPPGVSKPPKPYVLREASEHELADALRVIRSSYELDHEWCGCGAHIVGSVLPGVRQAFGDEPTCLFVQHGSRVIGASAFLPEPGDDGVHLVSGPCVLIEYCNRGIGTVLLAATLEALRARGFAEAVGQTRSGSVSAKYFYKKFGGQQVFVPPVAAAMEAAAAA